jgi:hypothetical protein
MRFISQFPGYKFQVRPMRQQALGDGGVHVTQEPIYAEFLPVHSGAMIWENETAAAMRHFEFRGMTQEQDEATPSDPIQRLSVFDTEDFAQAQQLSEDDKAEVEARLQQLCLEAPNECLMVTDKPIQPPFPRYDDFDGEPEQLMVKLVEDGHDLDLVLHYERTFGRKRPVIIDALEQTIEFRKEQTVSA